jgi:hypothetical protein
VIKYVLGGIGLGLFWFNELGTFIMGIIPQINDGNIKFIATGLIVAAIWMNE